MHSSNGAPAPAAKDLVSGGMAELRFPVVAAGEYRIRIEAGHSHVWLPATHDEAAAEVIRVDPLQETVYQASLPERGMLAGSVTGSWERMATTPPALGLYASPEGDPISLLRPTSDGEYQLWVFAPVRARLRISTFDHRRWHGGSSFEEAEVFELGPGDEIRQDIALSGIAGELGFGGSLSRRTTVVLHDASGEEIAPDRTDGDRGLFRFLNLVPGTYAMRIEEGPTWIAHWYDRADSFQDATPITITEPGELVWLEPSLLEGASISGTFFDAVGEPIVGGYVELVEPAEDRSLDHRSMSGPGGAFRILAVPDGVYGIHGRAGYPRDVWFPGTTDPDSAGTITVAGHADVTGIVLQLLE
ncbi:MAG: hypothetical protein GF346_00485 [Candidatus Eisenbacteria bacterium]|nr:hypothetical protein [Candidatus Latescibacterota bacterium]MBD3300910.1 hypothetical protein [Candidatus Eisenbacteria bacterium]